MKNENVLSEVAQYFSEDTRIKSKLDGLSDLDKVIFLTRLSDVARGFARETLYNIRINGIWKDRYASWEEFVTSSDGLNKSPGWASKEIAIYEYFVIQGGIASHRLDIDSTRLYMAIKLPTGDAEKKLTQASLLTRSELRNEILDPQDACKHPTMITICASCHKRV